jgi:hypothetical protein
VALLAEDPAVAGAKIDDIDVGDSEDLVQIAYRIDVLDLDDDEHILIRRLRDRRSWDATIVRGTPWPPTTDALRRIASGGHGAAPSTPAPSNAPSAVRRVPA